MNSNSENPVVGANFQKEVAQWFSEKYNRSFIIEKKIAIGYSEKKDHKFDVVSEDSSIVIECKCYSWTETGNVPSAKMGAANEAVFYLSFLPSTTERYLVMKKTTHPKHKINETLAEYYYRTNKHLLGGTKVAEFDVETKSLRVICESDNNLQNDIYSILELNDIRLKNFYSEFFINQDDVDEFLGRVYQMDSDDRIPRQMINQIYRFVTLSRRIDEIYPPRDGLRLLFIKICMESLQKLNHTLKGPKDFYERFQHHFSITGRDYILQNFKLIECSSEDTKAIEIGSLSISDFLNIIKYIRDQVAHDGIFWETQIFAPKDDWTYLVDIEGKNLGLSCVSAISKDTMAEYLFETTLQFDKFIYYFTEACINYVKEYIHLESKY